MLNKSLQGKVGPLSSSLSLAFKSWWKPSFTFNISGAYSRLIMWVDLKLSFYSLKSKKSL